MLSFGYIGGFGAMSYPAAKHFRSRDVAKVLRVLDRGQGGSIREAIRHDWRAQGAELVPTLDAVVRGTELDAIVICVGKNGDDLPLLRELFRLLEASRGKKLPAILHFSTVSKAFVTAACASAAALGIEYVNYPLTGGPRGAELGGADPLGMLILAGGKASVYERFEPALKVLGHPRYFGEDPCAGTTVKLIGQLMVFNGCIGVSSAAGLFAADFCGASLEGERQSEFFDFLNRGAGGTRQWDVALSKGVRLGAWDQGFLIKHAVVDAIYAADAAHASGLSSLATNSLLQIARGFSFLLHRFPAENLATHAIAKLMQGELGTEFDRFCSEHFTELGTLELVLEQLERSLPEAVRSSVARRPTPSCFRNGERGN